MKSMQYYVMRRVWRCQRGNQNPYDKVCHWLATCWWFSPGTSVSSTNKTGRHELKYHWKCRYTPEFKPTCVFHFSVGVRMSTKIPKGKPLGHYEFFSYDRQREDVTDQYKYKEGNVIILNYPVSKLTIRLSIFRAKKIFYLVLCLPER
jgi:hypothetical protein